MSRWGVGRTSEAEHGTPAGWSMHRAIRTTVCEACRLAHNAKVTANKRAADARAKEKP